MRKKSVVQEVRQDKAEHRVDAFHHVRAGDPCSPSAPLRQAAYLLASMRQKSTRAVSPPTSDGTTDRSSTRWTPKRGVWSSTLNDAKRDSTCQGNLASSW